MSWLRSLFFVRRCPYCHTVLTGTQPECDGCRAQFPEKIYHRQLPGGDHCLAPFRYAAPVSNSILTLKQTPASTCIESFSRQMVRILEQVNIHPDVITCIPLYWQNQWQRGFNQSEKLARCTARLLHCPYQALLKKIRKNEVQHHLSAEQRVKNVIGAYAYCGSRSLEGQTVLLMDDVCTTGSTLDECTRILHQQCHATTVIGVTAAMAGASTELYGKDPAVLRQLIAGS